MAAHRRERGQFALMHAERPAQLAHDGELVRHQRALGVDEIEQHVEQQKRQIAPSAAPGLEVGDRQVRREPGLLAGAETRDRLGALRRRKLHAHHQLLRRGDLRLRDAAIGLGDRAGELEQRREERARRGRVGALHGEHPGVPQMADDETEQQAERMAEQEQPDQRADQLAHHIHGGGSRGGWAAYHCRMRSSSASLSMPTAARIAAASRAQVRQVLAGEVGNLGAGGDAALAVAAGAQTEPRRRVRGLRGTQRHGRGKRDERGDAHGAAILAARDPVKSDRPFSRGREQARQADAAARPTRWSPQPAPPSPGVLACADLSRRRERQPTHAASMPTTLSASNLPGLNLLHRGKVRDVYALSERELLIVATDRLSAFDVVLPDPIPGKGEVLTQMSNFWFARTAHLVPNHLTGKPVAGVLPAGSDAALYTKRSVVVKRLTPVPIEAIARGYLIGSGWKDYQATGALCGIRLPPGLRQAEQLPEPIFTPSTKAAAGRHDENIGFDRVVALIGATLAEQVREATLKIYTFAAEYARARGILVADTKLEFGTDEAGRLHVMDEMLTPDSSRFWPADEYRVGTSPPSFDKQYVRDYLETLDWDKRAPGPRLPAAVIERTAAKYAEALRRLAGIVLD